MGEHDSPADKMSEKMKGYKKRMKQLCCCGTSWTLIGLGLLCAGIALLALFGSEWNNTKSFYRRNSAYVGVGLLVGGIVMLIVGIVLCVVFYKIWQRLTNNKAGGKAFKAPKFEMGKAPYPQQETVPLPAAAGPGVAPPPGVTPSAPAVPKGKVDQQDVHIEVTPHQPF